MERLKSGGTCGCRRTPQQVENKWRRCYEMLLLNYKLRDDSSMKKSKTTKLQYYEMNIFILNTICIPQS